MIIKTITISEWNTEAFNKSLQNGIKSLQNENEKLVVEVQFSTIYMTDREDTEYNALLIGRIK